MQKVGRSGTMGSVTRMRLSEIYYKFSCQDISFLVVLEVAAGDIKNWWMRRDLSFHVTFIR